MLHLSLFLFFSGLVIFLFNVNHSVYLSVISWIGFFSTLYGLMTMMPIIRYNGPYYTPSSSMAWLIRDCMQHALGTVLKLYCASSREPSDLDMPSFLEETL